jgi:hypothetical protein
MKYVKVSIVLAVLGAYPAMALAHKAPSKAQRTALVKAFDRNLKEPVPAKCLREQISTPNQSWAWVAFGGKPTNQLPVICAKFAADGRAVFHYRAGKWRWIASGSDFRNGNGSCSLSKKVPAKVISDLGLC